MRIQLKTKEHNQNIKIKSHKEKVSTSKGISTSTLQMKCSENACTAAQLLATHSLPNRFYSDMVWLINKILDKSQEQNFYIH